MSDQRLDNEDVLRALIKLGEQAPKPDPMQAARAKRAVRNSWQVSLQTRRQRQIRLGALATAATVALALGVMQILPLATPIAAQVASLSGELTVGGDDRTMHLGAGSDGVEIEVGATLVTTQQGSARLSWATAHDVRLGPSTTLEIMAVDQVKLLEGRIYLASDQGGTAIAVSTAYGTVEEIGTQFMVETVAGGARVLVREGAVRLGQQRFDAGHGASFDDVLTEPFRVATDADEWIWVRDAGGFELDGSTLSAFLEWICTEAGWQLDYASPSIRARAERERVSGSIEGLANEQAMKVVLATFELDFVIEGATLKIIDAASS